MGDRIRWGIIATGRIAHHFAKGIKGSRTGELVAVASRSQEKADVFAEEYSVSGRYGSYEALLADPAVDVVYVAVPHPMHAEWAVKAAQAGKHVLVEKPMAMNLREAESIVDAARANDVFLMEAFMYRCHPQTSRLAQLIREKVIGEVQIINATFGFQAAYDPHSRLFAPELGGGGILDVGCYPVSASRMVAGAAVGRAFENPIEFKATGTFAQSGVDGCTVAVVKFASGIIAQIGCAVTANMENWLKVTGSAGEIVVPTPWLPSRPGGSSGEIVVKRHGREDEHIQFDPGTDLYSYEVDTVAAHIADRQAPQMSWDDSLGNMHTLDAWRRELGIAVD